MRSALSEVMMNKKYSIGLDYGTESGRAVLVDVSNGEVVAQCTKMYTHGVMDEYLPDGSTKLPMDFALQHPMDYLEVAELTVPAVLKEAGVSAEAVVGLSTDFTSCTILPIDAEGTPLCVKPQFVHNPHAYVKLWKHHAAQPEANVVTELAEQRGEGFLARYGGKISSEWLQPKIMQILDEAPEVFDAADRIIEAADWLNLMLTGEERRSSCMAGYKGMWHKKDGYPTKDFMAALDPRLEDLAEKKLCGPVCPLGGKAGELTAEWAARLGLRAGTAVGISIIDAHAGLPGAGIAGPGKLMMIMGTSTCHIMLSETENMMPGVCGIVEDGVLPGYFAYEAGQACVGDHFAWLVKGFVPAGYEAEAAKRGIGVHQLLTEKASAQKVGEHGLLALDWWNGNRTPYADYDLTGMMLGMNLTTKAEDIYRALIEATAYGTNYVIETFEKAGISIEKLYACGGIAKKNPMMMQIYADVTGREIHVSASDQTPALGAAIFAAVAAGKENGGYDSIEEAVAAMSAPVERVYKPIAENAAVYAKLYAEYRELSEYFAKENMVMKRLKAIKAEAQ